MTPAGAVAASRYDRGMPDQLHFTESEEANRLVASGFVVRVEPAVVTRQGAKPRGDRPRPEPLSTQQSVRARLQPVR